MAGLSPGCDDVTGVMEERCGTRTVQPDSASRELERVNAHDLDMNPDLHEPHCNVTNIQVAAPSVGQVQGTVNMAKNMDQHYHQHRVTNVEKQEITNNYHTHNTCTQEIIAGHSHLKANSEVTIDFEAPRFVLTDVQDDVIEVLDDKGVVVLTGDPGCGKSYQGQAVLRHYRERGYTPYTLRSFTDWDSHVGPDTRSVVLADGLFGETLVDKAEHKAWTQVRKTATALTAKGHCKLAITVYPHVLRTLQQLENGTRSPLLDPVVVSLPGLLDTTVKTHLLHVHLKELNLPKDRQREVVETVLHKDVSGPVFAWCCDWMVRHWHSAQHPTDIFSQPAEAYVPLLRRLLLDTECGETMAAVLALAMRGLGSFLHDPRRVQPYLQELRFHGNLSDYRLEEHADLLKGFILAHDGYGFASRMLYDAAGLALGRAYSVPVMLQVCDVRFLVNYVTTDPQVDLGVIVGDKPGLRELYQQRLQQLTKTRVGQHVTALEELVRHVLIINDRQSWMQTAKSRVKELLKTGFKLKQRVLCQWPKAEFTSRSSQESLSRLQTQGACYLDAPSKPIPRSLLSVSVQDDEVSVDLAGQHLYLVLRLLTDTELGEQDDDGNTVFHLAALAGLWNILVMADRESLMISNKQQRTPIQTLRKTLQQSQLSFWRKSGNNLLLESFEASETTWKVGDTVLHWAVEKNKLNIVRLLIQHGASVNEKNYRDGKTALHTACKYFKMDSLLELLQHRAEVNVKDKTGNTLLHWAVEQVDADTVRLLIQHGASVNEKNEHGETALHTACKKCKGTDTVRELLQHGAEVNVKDNAGNTLLHSAAERGYTAFVLLLIQHGASVNEKNAHGKAALHMKDKAGNTFLHWAADQGCTDIVLLLIQHGASVNEKNGHGETALHVACKNYKGTDRHTVSELLQHGAEVNVKDNAGNTPLHSAAERGYTDTVRLLIQHGASVNDKNEDGKTALHTACKYSRTDTVRELLQHGAEVNVKDNAGNTPFNYAAERDHTDTVCLLIQHSASVNDKNKDGETALHMACKYSRTNTVSELLQHGAEVNVKENAGNTLLHWAVEWDSIVRLLIQHGASVNEKNKDGETALHSACKKCKGTDTVGELIQHGAEVNMKDNAGNTPLHWAVEQGYIDIVCLLIQHGASVTEKNGHGKTALHIACKVYYATTKRTVGELLQHGAEVNVKDNDGNTPLHRAAERGYTDTVRLLIQHGASVNDKNGHGKTALHIECKAYEDEMQSIEHYTTGPCGKMHNGPEVNGNTPLHLAAERGKASIVCLLIQHGASVNEKNDDGVTALHMACNVYAVKMELIESRFHEVHSNLFNDAAATLHILVQHGADVNVRDNVHITPLGWAKRWGNTEIVYLMKQFDTY